MAIIPEAQRDDVLAVRNLGGVVPGAGGAAFGAAEDERQANGLDICDAATCVYSSTTCRRADCR